jgi:hypothetical protein
MNLFNHFDSGFKTAAWRLSASAVGNAAFGSGRNLTTIRGMISDRVPIEPNQQNQQQHNARSQPEY